MRAFTKKLNLNVNHQFRIRPTEEVGTFNSYVPRVVPNTIRFATCNKKVYIATRGTLGFAALRHCITFHGICL